MDKLYVVVPEEHEKLMSVVVAKDVEEAHDKALTIPDLLELSKLNVRFKVVDIDRLICSAGYKLTVEKLGIYH